jgi:hypothetical protein
MRAIRRARCSIAFTTKDGKIRKFIFLVTSFHARVSLPSHTQIPFYCYGCPTALFRCTSELCSVSNRGSRPLFIFLRAFNNLCRKRNITDLKIPVGMTGFPLNDYASLQMRIKSLLLIFNVICWLCVVVPQKPGLLRKADEVEMVNAALLEPVKRDTHPLLRRLVLAPRRGVVTTKRKRLVKNLSCLLSKVLLIGSHFYCRLSLHRFLSS